RKRSNTRNQRGNDQRHRDQLQQIQENRTEGSDPIGRKFTPSGSRGYDPECQTQNESDDDLPVQLSVPGHRVDVRKGRRLPACTLINYGRPAKWKLQLKTENSPL